MSQEPDHAPIEAEAVEAQPDDDPRPVYEGDWATASGEEKGRHSERVRQWKARQEAANPSSADAPGSGSTTAVEERDRSLALRTARAVARDPNARDADKLTAARLLAGVEEAQTTGKPPAVERLYALPTDQLEALLS